MLTRRLLADYLHVIAPLWARPGYRHSWQACGLCKGAFVLWRNANEPFPTEQRFEFGRGLVPAQRFDPSRSWCHLDGRPVRRSEVPVCDTCGATGGFNRGPFRRRRRRWGDVLPEPQVSWVVKVA